MTSMESAAGQGGYSEVTEARARATAARGILLDWDGCAAINNRLHPAAVRFIAEQRDHLTVVSNNTTNLPEDFVGILARAGLEIGPERVVLAGTEALRHACSFPSADVLVLGDGRMRAYARRLGLRLSQKNPDVVVLLRDLRFSYRRLERAANALLRGARLIVANPDMTHPGADGAVVPETGALLAALSACVDMSRVEMTLIGKPAGHLFARGCATLGVTPAEAVMIGDNPDTDIAGAQRAGLASILVGRASGLTLADLLIQPMAPAASSRTRAGSVA